MIVDAGPLDLPLLLERVASECGLPEGRAAVQSLTPSDDPQEIEYRQARVAPLQGLLRRGETLERPEIAGLDPVLEHHRRPGLKSSIETLQLVAGMLGDAWRCRQSLEALAAEERSPVAGLIQGIDPHPALRDGLRLTVDPEDPEAGLLDTASSELGRLRRSLKSLRQELRSRMEGLSGQYKEQLQDGFVTLRGERFVLPVRSDRASQVAGVVHDHSASGQTLFVEPIEAIELNNRLRQAKEAILQEEERILRQWGDRLGNAHETLLRTWQGLIEYDRLQAIAQFAHRINAIAPQWSGHSGSDGQGFDLRRARHPLLALEGDVIPVDIALPEAMAQMVISGPNTGGKTVTLKTVGLLVAMAQMGLPVPVGEGSRLPRFGRILALVGDEQGVERHLSTFSSQLLRLRRILEQADASSLVLLDELGGGTDPMEGGALGVAVLEALLAKGCRALTTTHLSPLKTFADNRHEVLGARMAFDPDTNRPLYRLEVGASGTSHAIETAARLGLPEAVVARARAVHESSLSDYELWQEKRRTLEAQLKSQGEQIAAQERALGQKQEAQARREAEFKRKMVEEEQAAKGRWEEAIAQTRQELRNLIHKAQAEGRPHIVTEALREQRWAEEQIQQPATPRQWQVGDTARLTALGGRAVKVVAVEGGRITVEGGAVQLTVGAEALAPATAAGATLHRPTGGGERKRGRKERQAVQGREESGGPLTKIDLRGLRADEAEQRLLRGLDEALVAGMHEVEVVHGKGTGALQAMTQLVLRREPRAGEFHLTAGGGATWVELL
ncbi:MAG: hypothetical protein COX57_13100 [Alphaproteobacteria bacterium CG_4_10_14_0_2_um_filter_63_37]|nr:MAG: hypothetical protein AUJ55_06125 [Proteobacteria bacterium CG1_02_64_396]PJA23563.1 MAG: hypothetical protein COX57_13100 [Alphaproteobacteria bacterium CG_4_10_14_0_2_um_filter_63_37]